MKSKKQKYIFVVGIRIVINDYGVKLGEIESIYYTNYKALKRCNELNKKYPISNCYITQKLKII